MSLTFSDQQNKLSSLLGDSNTDTDSQFPLADRKRAINDGEVQFAADALNIKEYASGSFSSSTISIPSGLIEIFSFVVVVGGVTYVLTKNREISVKDLERFSSYSGSPPYYYIWRSSGTTSITLIGATSGTYQLFYFKHQTADLSADSDESIQDNEFRYASVFWAASQLLLQIGLYQRAGVLASAYQSYVERAMRRISRQTSNYERPNVDNNNADYPITDRQGGGWI